MWDFIKLTLSSNGKPTLIRVHSIVQIYEETNSDGKECPFGNSKGECMAADGNDITHYWRIKDELNKLGSEVES